MAGTSPRARFFGSVANLKQATTLTQAKFDEAAGRRYGQSMNERDEQLRDLTFDDPERVKPDGVLGSEAPPPKQATSRARLLVEIKLRIADGLTEDEIQRELGLTPSDMNSLMDEFYEARVKRMKAKSVEQTYVDFVVRSHANARALQRVARGLTLETDARGRPLKNGNLVTIDAKAAVMAIKSVQEVYESTIKVGQALGVLPTPAKMTKTEHSGEVGMRHSLAKASGKELNKQLVEEEAGIKRLVSYGNTDMFGRPILTLDADEESATAPSLPPPPEPPKFSGQGKPAFAKGGTAKLRDQASVPRKKA